MIKESRNLIGWVAEVATLNHKWQSHRSPFFDDYLYTKNTRDRLIPSGDIDDQIILQSDWLKALKVIWVFRESKRTLLCTIFWVKKENINELNFWQKKNNLFWKSSWAFSSKREFLRKTYLHQFLIFKTFLLHERFQENSISHLWKKLITDLLT